MREFEKWIEGVASDQSVSDVARHSLNVRLAAVQYYLPLAAERADEDAEYVHQLRVYTRRSTAALNLYAKTLPKKEVKWFRKQLRKIRRAAGAARDLDVLAERHSEDVGRGADAFRADLQQLRRAAQEPIVKLYRKLRRNGRLDRQVESILTGASSHVADIPFGEWARRRLRRSLQRFCKASPADTRDLDSLHRFRIRGKELRYAIELLSAAFPRELRQQFYPTVEQLQEQLGTIHDHAVAADRLQQWARATQDKHRARRLRAVLADERRRIDEAISEFSASWSEQTVRQFRVGLEELLCPQYEAMFI